MVWINNSTLNYYLCKKDYYEYKVDRKRQTKNNTNFK